jgi:hypothetical protein
MYDEPAGIRCSSLARTEVPSVLVKEDEYGRFKTVEPGAAERKTPSRAEFNPTASRGRQAIDTATRAV